MNGSITIGIVVVFIIVLALSMIYRTIEENNKTVEWPPHITKCPEYWDISAEDNTKCVNKTGINGMVDEKIDAYDGSNADKLSDESNYGTWDGISNFN